MKPLDVLVTRRRKTTGSLGLKALLAWHLIILVMLLLDLTCDELPLLVAGHGKYGVDGMTQSDSSWRQACTGIAQAYQLSPRESEVFLLLARGRNAEYIQGQLVISLHTAKSHIANIYQKLGVHSIQEMLDLIDLYIVQKTS
ncbi:MAG: helix-turn-helix transcriptional regulator [Coriobacteriia bacterium]|nr:helix-turn-helix transcriptional regulator [Coriobacteriia bacterium]